MADLLDAIRAEIRERLAASRAAVEEYSRLEAALRALEQSSGGRSPTGVRSTRARRRPPPADAASAFADGGSKAARARAPRGANRDAVLGVIEERAGVTAAELVQATGIERGALNAVLRRLLERGQVRKQDLPGGQAGYSIATREREIATEESPDDPTPAPTAGTGGETETEEVVTPAAERQTAGEQPSI